MALSRLRALYSAVVSRRGRLDLLLHRVFYGRDRLRLGFYQRGPWITSFTVDGKTYGGYVNFDEDARLAKFSARFPPPARVLELGSLEGGQTFRLAAAGYDVLAVEGRAVSAERARWLQGELRLEHAEFVVANLEQTALSSFGRFDVVLCCGLLSPAALLGDDR